MPATQITEAIKAQTPALAEIYAHSLRQSFERIDANFIQHGKREPASHDYVWGWDVQQYWRASRPEGGSFRGRRVLDEDLVLRTAQRDAEACASAYASKVEGKAAGMHIDQVTRMTAEGTFTVRGTKAGHKIEIRQSLVFKTSSKGTRFAAFPALVYIDGKKSTEAALKRL